MYRLERVKYKEKLSEISKAFPALMPYGETEVGMRSHFLFLSLFVEAKLDVDKNISSSEKNYEMVIFYQSYN